MSNHLYRNTMQANPLGIDQLNSFCQSQLGEGGYNVVLAVYNSLNTLNVLAQNLPVLGSVANSSLELQGLAANIGAIQQVNMHLQMLMGLANDIPTIKQLAPQIAAFNKDLQNLNQSVHKNNVETEKLQAEIIEYKHKADTVFLRYEQQLETMLSKAQQEISGFTSQALKTIDAQTNEIHKMYSHIMRSTKTMNDIIANNAFMYKALNHLLAADAVNTVGYTLDQCDYQKALEAIAKSESLGNEECILKEKLDRYIKGEVQFIDTINQMNATYLQECNDTNITDEPTDAEPAPEPTEVQQ